MRPRFDLWVRKIPWKREWLPTLVFLPGKSHGQRSLAGYSLWGRKESDTTEQVHFIVLFLCTEVLFRRGKRKVGEGNGTPLQYFYLENPMDREAW